MKGPIVWVGGKYRMAKNLLPLIPPHNTYVEPFGGGAQLLFAKQPSPIEVYNDVDSGLVNFFQVLRNNFDDLHRLLILTPYSREEYIDCRDTWEEIEDPVEKARRWFVVCRQSFGGIFGSSWGFATRSAVDVAGKWVNVVDGLLEVVERFRRVQIECKDFREILALYDAPGTLFYADPPYLNTDLHYKDTMTEEDHKDLINLLLQIKGMAIISGYNHPIYDALGWKRCDFNTVSYTSAQTKVTKNTRPVRVESVWISPRVVEWVNNGRLF